MFYSCGGVILSVIVSCSSSGAKDQGSSDSDESEDASVVAAIVAARLEAQKEAARLDSLRQDSLRRDSIKAVEGFEKNILKPSDIFTGARTEFPVRSDKQLCSLLATKGYKLISKKTVRESNEVCGDYTSTNWTYRLSSDEKYFDTPEYCEVKFNDGHCFRTIDINFSSSQRAKDFMSQSAPYIHGTAAWDSSIKNISDYLGMRRKGNTINIFQTGE